MISYAQNREDVVLHRLLNFVPVGTYVDVGAGHPVHDNVTYDLHRAGWRGINVEPMPREVELLRAERPDDITVQAALGAAPGTVTLFEAPLENRGATTANAELAQRYMDAGQEFRPFVADVLTLDAVLAEHHRGDLHLLKIDVEGAEPEVLRGFDLRLHRPWVVVIESTEPNSTTDTSASFEPSILAAGYRLSLFDGLNRFYVRDDLLDIHDALATPANVFDDWTTFTEMLLRQELMNAGLALEAAQHSLADAAEHAAALEERAMRAEAYAVSLEQRALRAEQYSASLEAERAQRASGSEGHID